MKPTEIYQTLVSTLMRITNNRATTKVKALLKPNKPKPMTLAEIIELQQEVIASLADEVNRLSDKLKKEAVH